MRVRTPRAFRDACLGERGMDDDLVQEFVAETADGLAEVDGLLLALERDPSDADALARIFRIVHTIKGTCGFFGFARLEALAHAAESLLDPLRSGERVLTPAATDLLLAALDRLRVIVTALRDSGQEGEESDEDLIAQLLAGGGSDPASAPVPAQPSTTGPDAAAPAEGDSANRADGTPSHVRVRVDVLESLMATVSELVLTRNRLTQIAAQTGADAFALALARLSHVTGELQDGVMRARMQAVGTILHPLTRLARDLARDLGKPLALDLGGEEVELDRQVLERIKDPLTHLVRNAADHGIETPQDRAAAGKPQTGRIRVTARAEGGHVTIEVADDGRGLDLDAIRAKALARGLLSEAAASTADDRQLADLVFTPGFSTAAAVTSISGRGVGMDVVRRNLEEIGGSVEAVSSPGQGTRFRMKIPLTLAIVPALILEAGGQRFALPQLNVRELVRPAGNPDARVEDIHGMPVLTLRGRVHPLLSLARRLDLPQDGDGFATVILVEIGADLYGLGVDAVLSTDEIVVKPLAGLLRGLAHVSGTTILGDGSVAMILDAAGLAAGLTFSPAAPLGEDAAPAAAPARSYLTLRLGAGANRALPLDAVDRVHQVARGSLAMSGRGEVADIDGTLVPVIRLAGAEDIGFADHDAQCLVLLSGPVPAALAVDAVLDIVEGPPEPAVAEGCAPIAAVMRLGGEAVDLLDLAWLADRAAARAGDSRGPRREAVA